MLQQTPKKRVLFVRRPVLALLVLFGVFSVALVNLRGSGVVQAAGNDTINFQARLETAAGAIAPDGNYNVEFKLYAGSGCTPANGSGCTALWTEDYTNSAGQGVRVANGYLTANLGSITPFPAAVDWSQPLYISMNIGGTATTSSVSWDGAMLPYLKLTAVPYAMSAASAVQLQDLQGSYTGTLSFDSLSANQSILLPNLSGTVCLSTSTNCGSSSGNGNYIQNGTSLQSGANFNIDGTGEAGTFNATNAVQTAGVTRIDASGNLTNIGSISGTGPLQLSGTTGSSYIMSALGLGTTNPQSGSVLTVANSSWISGVSSSGSGFVNMFQVNSDNQIQVGAALNVAGGIILPTDGGQLTFADLPIDTSASAGTAESYTFRVGSTNVLTVYGEADGSGGLQNGRVAIGTSIAPQYTLDVGGDVNTTGTFRVNGTPICTSTCAPADGSQYYIQNGTALQTSAEFNIQPTAGSIAGQIRANGAGDLLQLQNAGGTVLTGFNASGQLYYQVGSYTAAFVAGTLTGNRTYTLPDASGTVCLTSGNCVGTGGAGGAIGGTGTANTLAMFTAAGTIGNSILTQSGTTVTVGGNINTSGSYYVNGTAGLSSLTCTSGQNLQGATVAGGIVTGGSCAAGGVTTIGTLNGGTLSGNGATISGSTLYLQSASGSYPGLVSAGTQTFSGSKTFSALTRFSSGIDIGSSQKISGTGAGNFDFINSGGGGWYFDWIQNGSTAMKLDTSNNLLIGTTTDSGSNYKLQAAGDAYVTGSVNAGTGYRVNGTAGLSSLTCASTDVLQGATVAGGIVTGGSCASGAGGSIGGSGTANTLAMFTAAGTIGNSILTQTGTTGISIAGSLTTTGSLGVGVASPLFNLDVNGDAYIDGRLMSDYQAVNNLPNGDFESGTTRGFTGLSGVDTTDSVNGQYSAYVTGSQTVMSTQFIPVDANGYLSVEGWFKSTGSGGLSEIYFGIAAYDGNKSALSGNGGTYGYCAADAVMVPTTWTKYTCTLQGTGTNINQFPVGTKYVKALILANYGQDSTYQLRVDGLSYVTDRAYTTASNGTIMLGGAGNVGIGTITPAYKLDVNGSANATTVYQNGNQVCDTSGNCVGTGGAGGSIGGSGTANTLAMFTAAGTIGNSILTQSGTTVTVGGNFNATGALAVQGASSSTIAGDLGVGTVSPGQKLDVQGGNINTSGAIMTSGTVRISTAGALQNVTADTSILTSGTLGVARGGTGANTLTAGGILLGNGTGAITATGVLANGQILIGDGSGAPTAAALTPGTGVAITNGAGSITVGVDSTVCTTAGNCVGQGNPNNSIGGSGTVGKLALFTGSGYTIGDSIMSQTGTTIGVAGTIQATTFNANTIQTNGTARIDASGNLVNIGSISGTGPLQLSGTTGSSYIMSALGLGTTNPQAGAALTIANSSWISSIDASGSGFINMFQVNSDNQIQVGAALNVGGGIVLPSDSGPLTLVDEAFSSGVAAGTASSYTLGIGQANALTVYGENDGNGNAQNVRVAIGSSITPQHTLDVTGDIAASTKIYQGGNQVCDTSGNCVGTGGTSNSVGGSGTAGTIALFTGSGYTIGDSILTQSGTTIGVAGTLQATTSVLAPVLDTASAGNLSIGSTNATSISIGKTGTDTTIGGNLKVATGGYAQIGSFTTMSETGGGLATIFGDNIIASPVSNNQIRRFTGASGDLGNYIQMRYDRGIVFGTGVSSTIGTDVADNTNERMRIDLSGNVGIGTASPAHRLDVVGDINTTGNYMVGGTTVISSAGVLQPAALSGNYTGLTGTGALSAGSIASGFGTISTGNNITTTAALQGGTLSAASGSFAVNTSGNVTVALSSTTGTTLICQNASSQLASCTNSYETTTGTDFIQNQSSSPQTANFNISGTGKAGTLNATTALQTAGTLSVGTASQFQVDASGNTSTTGTSLVKTTSATAFQVQNGSGGSILDVNSSNGHIGIGTSASTQVLQLTASTDTAIGLTSQGVSIPTSTSTGALAPQTATGGSAWTSPNNAEASDGAYASADGNSGEHSGGGGALTVSNYGFTIPAGATINGIVAKVQRNTQGDGGYTTDYAIQLMKGGTAAGTNEADTTTHWPDSPTESYATYGSPTDLWGQSWTPADINSANFGLSLTANVYVANQTQTADVDHVSIDVYYTYNVSSDINWTLGSNHSNTGNFEISAASSLGTNNALSISSANGAATFQNSADSTSAFQIQNSSGAALLTADTANAQVTISSGSAQPVTFINAWGGTGNDNGASVVQTSDGGYAVAGYTNSFGAGGYDVFLTKYDADGSLSWSKTWGGTGNDEATSLVQTSDGGYAITGYTTSYGAGGNDMFLIKLTSSGSLSWSKTWGGTGNDAGQSLVQTSDGGYAVTGYSYSYGAGNDDAFLAKFTSSGSLSWSKTWGNTGYDTGNSVIQTSDGGYAITGTSSSNVFLVKYDSSGNLQWNKTWVGGAEVGAYSVIQTSDGGYATSGYIGDGNMNNKMFLTKYDSSGNIQWNHSYAGTIDAQGGNSVIQTTDGGYAVVGNTGYPAADADVLLAKYDSSGTMQWSHVWSDDLTQGTGSTWTVGNSVAQTSDGGYAVAGSTTSYGAGSYDMFLAKYDSNGDITNCSTTVCHSLGVSTTALSTTTSSPTMTTSSPSVTIGTPNSTVSNFIVAGATVVAPNLPSTTLNVIGSVTASGVIDATNALRTAGTTRIDSTGNLANINNAAIGGSLLVSTSSTQALQIQNSSGASLLVVNTSNMQISVGGPSVTYSKAATTKGGLLFSQPLYTSNSNGASDIVTANLNGDPYQDIIIPDGSSVAVMFGYGDGTFGSKTDYGTIMTNVISVAVGDFNGDGKTDFVVSGTSPSNYDQYVQVFLNNGNGTFTSSYTSGYYYSSVGNGGTYISASDLNGDGKTDFVVERYGSISGHNYDGVAAYINGGSGTSFTWSWYSGSAAGYWSGSIYDIIKLTDVNNDGYPDIILAGSETANGGDVGVLINNKNGTFAAVAGYGSTSYYTTQSVTTMDVNNDGYPDIIYSYYNTNNSTEYIAYLLNNGNGTFGSPTNFENYSSSNSFHHLATADLDNDGNDDLISINTSGGSVYVFANNGNGTFAQPIILSGNASFEDLATADVTNDNKIDIIAGSSSSTYSIAVFKNSTTLASPASSGSATLSVTSTSSSSGGLFIQGASGQTAKMLVIQGASGGALLTVDALGNLSAKGAVTGGVASPDYAENIGVSDPSIGAGDVVAMNPDGSGSVVKATKPYSSAVMGVISTHPGFVTNASNADGTTAADQRPLALSGRVPVKVSTENGAIHTGDYLTSSDVPGVAMKATGPGAVIGVAMESFDGTQGLTQACGDYVCGSILFFINPSAVNPNLSSLQGSDAAFNTVAVTGALSADSINIGGLAKVGSLTVTGDASFQGNVTVTGDMTLAGHFITTGSTPTALPLPSAGSTGVAISLTGNDVSGTVVITVGQASAPATKDTPAITGPELGDMLKLVFAEQYGKTPRVMLTPNDAASAALLVYPSAISAQSFNLSVAAQPQPGATYSFTYLTIQ